LSAGQTVPSSQRVTDGSTQPAASHALTRLRLLLGDPLFVRKGSGVAPTARAVQLSTSVTGALAMLSAALNEPDAFDPLQSRRRFLMVVNQLTLTP
jgi:DNA-binding transcriptional LysR family regulator